MPEYQQLELITESPYPPGYLLYRDGIKYSILISPNNKLWVLTKDTGRIEPHSVEPNQTYEQVQQELAEA